MDPEQNAEQAVQQEEAQPMQQDVTEASQPEKTLTSSLALLIILLVATIVGAGVWFYAVRVKQPEVISPDQTIAELRVENAINKKLTEKDSGELPNGYEIKDGGVYYMDNFIPELDSVTFIVDNEYYVRDKNGLYFLRYGSDGQVSIYKEDGIVDVVASSSYRLITNDTSIPKEFRTFLGEDLSNYANFEGLYREGNINYITYLVTSDDFNDDGNSEFVVENIAFNGLSMNGAQNGVYMFYAKINNVWNNIGEVWGTGYWKSETKINGYYDITTSFHNLGFSQTITNYSWDVSTLSYKGESSYVDDRSQDRACLAAGTKISMANGSYKNIEDIVVGDIVTSYNPATGEYSKAEVDRFIERKDPLVIINDTLRAAPDEPVYLHDGTIVLAMNLKVGDHLLNEEGEGVEVKTIEYNAKIVDTYDFTLRGADTFFADGYLVGTPDL